MKKDQLMKRMRFEDKCPAGGLIEKARNTDRLSVRMTVQTYEAGLMTEQEFNQKLINHVKRGEL
jgi:hypothetical protein